MSTKPLFRNDRHEAIVRAYGVIKDSLPPSPELDRFLANLNAAAEGQPIPNPWEVIYHQYEEDFGLMNALRRLIQERIDDALRKDPDD